MSLKPDDVSLAGVILRSVSLFEGIPEDAQKVLVEKLAVREVAPGKVLLMDQEINKTLFLLATGKVGVYKRVGGGRQQLAVLQSPEVFGERSMFEDSPASSMVKSEEPCRLFTLERPDFEAVAAKFPQIVEPIQKNLASLRAKRITPAAKPPEGSAA